MPDFPLSNLPFGVFSAPGDQRRRVGVAIGDHVLDAGGLAGLDGLPEAAALQAPTLNPYLSLGRPAWSRVRAWLTERLGAPAAGTAGFLHDRSGVVLHLPIEVADYVDFYSSEHHASNVGRIFRPGGDMLPPNWRHMPIGYHGRAGTVVVGGTPIRRPSGQHRPAGQDLPAFGPSERLDVEAEVGFIVGMPSEHGSPVPIGAFADHVFGAVLLNDWSARDLQAWESVPLGPFLGKSFATTISPWIVPLDALAAARVPPPTQDPRPLPYLRTAEPWGLDLQLSVAWNGTVVSRPPFATMYWTAAQQLAHLTVNGASLRTGDLYGSGTVSGPVREERGSFLELSWGGREPVELAPDVHRTFVQDGDTVVLTATAPAVGGGRLGFGELTGTVLPAR